MQDSSGRWLASRAWEGDEGLDIAPGAGREIMETRFRERAVFEDMGWVENHEQKLGALRYSIKAYRLGEDDAFHEELGYWLWDGANGQVLRCFLVPRGVSILAGGSAMADDQRFSRALLGRRQLRSVFRSEHEDRNLPVARGAILIHEIDRRAFRDRSPERLAGSALDELHVDLDATAIQPDPGLGMSPQIARPMRVDRRTAA